MTAGPRLHGLRVAGDVQATLAEGVGRPQLLIKEEQCTDRGAGPAWSVLVLHGLALTGDGRGGSGNGFGVAKVPVLERLELVVQLIDQGNAGGDIQSQDFLVGDVVKVFD